MNQKLNTYKMQTWANICFSALLFVGITLMLFACSGGSAADSKYMFRQANLGMSNAQIKLGETVKLVTDSPETLKYVANMGEGDSADIIYHFSPADKLIEMEFNMTFDTAADAQKTHTQLLHQFAKDYKSSGPNSWIGKGGGVEFQVFVRRSESITEPGLHIVWQEL